MPLRPLAARLIGALIRLGARILTGAQARWKGSAPLPVQRIYFANHTSHFDFVLLWASLPPELRARTRPVAAADYWQQGWFRRFLMQDVFRATLIDRERIDRRHDPIATVLAALDSGDSIVLFPEGTRGNGDQLLPFKSGIFHLALRRPQIELVPVWIANLHRVMPKGARLPVPLLCTLTFGEPQTMRPEESKTEFLERLQRRLLSLRDQ